MNLNYEEKIQNTLLSSPTSNTDCSQQLKSICCPEILKNYADLIINVLKTLMTSCNYLWPVFSAMVYYEDSYYF